MRSAVVDLSAQPIRNLAAVPRATTATVASGTLGWTNTDNFGAGGAGSYGLISGITDHPAGITTALRKTFTTVPTATSSDAYGNGFAHHAAGSQTLALPVRGGAVYTFSAWLRPSWAGSSGWIVVDAYTAAPARVLLQSGPATTLAADKWTRVSYTLTLPATAQYIRVFTRLANTSALPPVNGTLDGTGLFPVQGPDPMVYCDGNTPGWRWTGTAGQSESVGYPYTLESLVGRPVFTSTALSTGTVATNLPGLSWTGFTVADVATLTAGAVDAITLVGNPLNDTTANTFTTMRTQGGPSSQHVIARRTGAAGPMSAAGTAAAGRHVITYGWNASLFQFLNVDNFGTTYAESSTPMAGTPSTIRVEDSATHDHLVTYLYAGELPLATRQAVVRWLANRYGVTLAA